jgi:SOS-response transcriptional repressor LexA
MQHDLETMAVSTPSRTEYRFPGSFLTPKGSGTPVSLDLKELLTPNAESTYLFRINGHVWADQGVVDGDIAIVDKELQPQADDLVINWHEGGFSVCRYWQLTPGEEALGVVTNVIHPLHR